MSRKSELLAPAGSVESARAAIQAGADALYVGMPGFNARNSNRDLSVADLGEIANLSRGHGVPLYFAANILLKDHEFDFYRSRVRESLEMGAAAFIVQDLAAVELIRSEDLHIPIHASTQMSTVSSRVIEKLSELGITRFTLARELSLEEIQNIKKATSLELEVFVHGSLCISYSGQCYTSLAFGERSGNRGQCAQSCRHPYDVVYNGRPIQQMGYPVSPYDFAAKEMIRDLVHARIDSFKIEGRMKSAQYVSTAVQYYRKMIDRQPLEPADEYAISLSFSRGFSGAWMWKAKGENLVPGSHNSHRGIYAGSVLKIAKGNRTFSLMIRSSIPLEKGDGILISRESQNIYGGYIYHAKARGKEDWEIELSNDAPFREMRIDDQIYVTSKKNLSLRLKKDLQKKSQPKHPISISAVFESNQPLVLKAFTGELPIVEIRSTDHVEQARSAHLKKEDATRILSSGGDSIFFPEKVSVQMQDRVYYPHKKIREIRQLLLKESEERFKQNKKNTLPKNSSKQSFSRERKNQTRTKNGSVPLMGVDIEEIQGQLKKNRERSPWFYLPGNTLHLIQPAAWQDRNRGLIESIKKIENLIQDFPFDRIYYEPGRPEQIKEAWEIFRQSGMKFFLVLPPVIREIHYSNRERVFRIMDQADGFVVRNIDDLIFTAKTEKPIVADSTLNAVNRASALRILSMGAWQLTSSEELTIREKGQWEDQLLKDLYGTDQIFDEAGGLVEKTANRWKKGFVMDYCPVARYSPHGSDFPECKVACTKNSVELVDRKGKVCPVVPDMHCINTMYIPDEEWKKTGGSEKRPSRTRYEAIGGKDLENLVRLTS